MRTQAEWDHLRFSDPDLYNLAIQADSIEAAGGKPEIIDRKVQVSLGTPAPASGLTEERCREIANEVLAAQRGPIVRGLVSSTKEYIASQLQPLLDRIAVLETAQTSLQAQVANLRRGKGASDAIQ
jgi:hypothetical protein